MRRIHVRLNLENEAAELGLVGRNDARLGDARLRRGRKANERLEQLADAVIVDGRAEKNRRLRALEVARVIELRRRAAHELDVLAQARASRLSDCRHELGATEPVDPANFGQSAAVAALVQVGAVFDDMKDPAKLAPHADRPRDRHAGDLEHGFDIVEQVDGWAPFPIQLIDEADDRRRPQPADLHELDRSRLDALGRIDDHESAVDGCQSSVGIFGKVLVSRCIEQVDERAAVGKLHDRGRDGNAALLLEPHPVRCRMPRGLTPFDRARHLDSPAEQQEFFRQRGFAGVRMRNDRERSPLEILAHP